MEHDIETMKGILLENGKAIAANQKLVEIIRKRLESLLETATNNKNSSKGEVAAMKYRFLLGIVAEWKTELEADDGEG